MTALAPLISVIIPHLNQSEFLRRCLSALRDQSFAMESVEIIVVDNGSKTLPIEICNSFHGVRLEQEATPGPGPARNKGVSVSRGEILAFIDADCIADRGWLSAVAARLDGRGADQIIGGDVRIALQDRAKPTALEAYESIFAYRQQEYIERQGFSGTGNLAVRRAAYDRVGAFAGIKVAEDREWGRRAIRLGYTVRYFPEMIVFHPARKTFDEIYAKWDRHISHDFEEYAKGFVGRLRWTIRAIAVALSPIFEVRRIMTSRRVASGRERCLALIALIRIRIYRATLMLIVLIKGGNAESSRFWNRT